MAAHAAQLACHLAWEERLISRSLGVDTVVGFCADHNVVHELDRFPPRLMPTERKIVRYD